MLESHASMPTKLQENADLASTWFQLDYIAGVSIGAGWQSLVAFINTGCYYIVGLPLGAVLGFKLKMNVSVLYHLFRFLESWVKNIFF